MDSNNLGILNIDFKLKSQQEGVGLETKNCLPKRMYTASSLRGLEERRGHGNPSQTGGEEAAHKGSSN